MLVHSISQDHRIFDRQVQHFRSRFRLLLVDLPGHGTAAAQPGPFGHEEYADYILTVTVELNGPVVLWGTHTGATTGLLAALREGDRFAALVLEGPLIAGQNPPVVQQHQRETVAAIQSDGLAAGLDVWWTSSCWFEQMRAKPGPTRAGADRAIINDFGATPWLVSEPQPRAVRPIELLLSKLDCPLLIYNREGDHPDFVTAARWLCARLSGARYVTVPGTGGFPAWEAPDVINNLVDDFVSQALRM